MQRRPCAEIRAPLVNCSTLLRHLTPLPNECYSVTTRDVPSERSFIIRLDLLSKNINQNPLP